jgi:uncharacterized protein
MSQSNAETLTTNAARYMTQLSKHWSHKYPVTFDKQDARIELPSGPLTMHVEPDKLLLTLEADETVLPRMQGVVEEHVRRFAFRETLEFTWSPAA